MPLSFPASPSVGATSTQNGREYTWTGYAWELVAASGSGEDSLLRSLFVPPAPTGVTASAGNAQATVSWTAPTVLAQTPITDYVVQFKQGSGSWETFTDGTSTATSATVTGLTTNGTAYQFRVAGVNAVGQGPWSAASSAVTPVAGDPLWASVQLLLPGDTSTNDASSYSRSVAAVGGAAVSTAQKRWGAGSLSFDGSNYLSGASSLELGSNDYVIECWINISSIGNNAGIVSKGPVAGVNNSVWCLQFNGAASTLAVFIPSVSSSINIIVGTANVVGNGWHHVAVSRSGSTTRLFVDGQQDGNSYTGNYTIADGNPWYVGGGWYAPTQRTVTGYIDDLRITVGSDRGYTGSTIPVPTAAFPDE